MIKMLDFVPSAAWIAAVGLLLAASAVQTVRLSNANTATLKAEATLAHVRQESAERAAKVAILTREATDAARLVESKMARLAQENSDAIEKEHTKSTLALAAARRDVVGLRNHLDAFAATGIRPGQAAGDPPGCRKT